MGRRGAATFLIFTVAVFAAGTDPKPKADDYQVHAATGNISLGAEFMVRSFQGQDNMFIAKDYLVVEVAVYPPKFEKIKVSTGQFTLRVNGKKQALSAQPPSFVAASLKYPDWERRPTVMAGGGLGDAGIILGPPTPTERFPGDPRPSQTRLPYPRRVPETGAPAGIEKEEPPRAEEVVIQTAFPEGEFSGPVSGYVYFPYKKKTKSIRTLELLYQGPEGSATLRLR